MIPPSETEHYLRINEIKNYVYCPRIPFYTLILHLDRATALSQAGIEAEQTAKHKMKRRKHALHQVQQGERLFDLWVFHHDLQIVGQVDEVVTTTAGIYLVDYKDTDQDYGYWKLQLCAYQLAAEAMGKTVLGCYIYTIPDQTYHDIKITRREHNKLHTIIQAVHSLLEQPICPAPTPHTRKCLTCQYRRFCNDRS